MSVEHILPNAIQAQQIADKPVPLSPVADALKFVQEPATGIVTVDADTAVQLAAGASPVSGRRTLVVTNRSKDIAVRIGGSNVTQKAGYLLEPQGTVVIEDTDTESEVSVYGRSTGYAVELEVIES